MKSYLQILRESKLKKEEAEALDESNAENKSKKSRYLGKLGADANNKTKGSKKLYPGSTAAIKLGRELTKEEAELAEKKDMSKGDIAALAGHKGKVDAADFKALRNKEHLKKEGNEMSNINSIINKLTEEELSELFNFMMEEVEALDEVSGAKLGSYMVKARKNHDSSMEKRNDAIDAGDKDTARKLGAVAQKRQKGLSKAIDKLNGSGFAKVHATEEAEQIDELSKKTLGSYVKKANRDTYLAGKFSDTDKEARAAGRKRKAGVAMAVDKLTKEEVEAPADMIAQLADFISRESKKK